MTTAVETVPDNLTLAKMADHVRINLNREPGLTDTPWTNLLADIKAKIRLRYYEVWDTRNWPETLVFGVTENISATQTLIDLPETLSLITKVKTGDTVLEPQDQDKDRQTPYDYVNLGSHGIMLRSTFSSPTTLTIDGKECFPGLPSDQSVPCIPCQLMLIDIVTSDFLSIDETDDARAAKRRRTKAT